MTGGDATHFKFLGGRGLRLLLLAVLAAPVAAQNGPSTSRPGSILFFPQLLVDADHETVVRVTNTSNSMRLASCFYVSGDTLQETGFDLVLTKQQPTHWLVSTGRQVDPTDRLCSRVNGECGDAGLDPGLVPAMQPSFRGELVCVQTDESGFPSPGNSLTGEVTVRDTASGDSATYTALAVQGNPDTFISAPVLQLNASDLLPNGDYAACPQTLVLTHLAAGAADPLAGPGSTVQTELTLVSCSQDFANRELTAVTVGFDVTNEFEQKLSASIQFTDWLSASLTDISGVFGVALAGSASLRTQITPLPGGPGVLAVAREVHAVGAAAPVTASAAANLHIQGSRADIGASDVISLPSAF